MSFNDPTLSMTLNDMALRVAEYLGIANLAGATPAVPADAADLARVYRCINDGYRRVAIMREWMILKRTVQINIRPPLTSGFVTAGAGTSLTDTGRTEGPGAFVAGQWLRIVSGSGREQAAMITAWNAVTKTFTLSQFLGFVVGAGYQITGSWGFLGESWRYFMPEDFMGSADVTWSMSVGDGVTSNIVQSSEAAIRLMRESSTAGGIPSFITVTPAGLYATASTAAMAPLPGQRWEMMIWPEPDASYVIQGKYTAYPQLLTAGTDRHIMGPAMDELILAAALTEAERQFMDGGDGRCERYFMEAMEKAVRWDRRSSTRRLGTMREPSDVGVRNDRQHSGVSTYNGAAI